MAVLPLWGLLLTTDLHLTSRRGHPAFSPQPAPHIQERTLPGLHPTPRPAGPQPVPHIYTGTPACPPRPGQGAPSPVLLLGGPQSRKPRAGGGRTHSIVASSLRVSGQAAMCRSAGGRVPPSRAGPGRAVPGQSAVLLAGAQELLQAGPKEHAAKVEQHGPPRHGRPPRRRYPDSNPRPQRPQRRQR